MRNIFIFVLIYLLCAVFHLTATAADKPEAVAVLTALDASTADGKGNIPDRYGIGANAHTDNGATVVTDMQRGKAIRFTGDKSRLILDKSVSLDNLRSKLTVSMWINPEQLPDGDSAMLMTKRPGWWMGKPFSLNLGRDGSLSVNYHDGKWGNISSGANRVVVGKWQHVAFTYQAGGQIALYLNGKVVGRRKVSKALTVNGEAIVCGYEKGGNFQGGKYVGFKGMMDDIHIFPVVLTAEQIGLDMKEELPLRKPQMGELPKRGLMLEEIPQSVRVVEEQSSLEAWINFGKDVQAKGLWFSSLGMKPVVVKTRSGEKEVWAAQQGSASGIGHARSVQLVVADERFRDGRMPVVDIEITCMNPAWSSVSVWADTAKGSRRIGGIWGNHRDFKTFTIALDDAYFGSRDFGNPLSMLASDGYDLRINSSNEELRIKSVKLTGYDRKKNVNFKRLLKLMEKSSPEGVFLFANKGEHQINLQWHNYALIPFSGEYSYRIVRHDGTEVCQGQGTLSVESQKIGTLKLPVKTDGLRNDIYCIELNLQQQGREIGTINTYFGVHNPGIPRKSADGDFLYGMDVMLGDPWKDPDIMQWLDLLGPDIIRGGGKLADFEKSMPLYQKHKLKVMAVPDLKYAGSSEKMDQLVPKLAEDFAAVAKKFPEIKYWEIGNEPDLPGFFSGPIEEYVKAFVTVYKAIKKANPDTVVMNGGLSFHGHEGGPRSEKFIELIPADSIDALAYHGHGPLDEAERSAFKRIRNTARKYGKNKLPFIETESGVAANKPSQEVMQARTVIQKIVYAQSQGLPAFFWFRLRFEHPRSYGNLQYGSHKEPRPAVLAYKTIKETLGGHQFIRKLAMRNADCQAYLFHDKKTMDNVLVCWTNKPTPQNALLSLAPTNKNISGLTKIDLYGNGSEQELLPGGLTQITVTQNPVFLKWREADGMSPVKVADSIIDAPNRISILPGGKSELTLKLNNPFKNDIDGELTIAAQGEFEITALPKKIPVKIAAGGSLKVESTLQTGKLEKAIEWPQIWSVFPGIDSSKMTQNDFVKTPEKLPGMKGTVSPRKLRLKNNTLDFTTIGGVVKERNTGVCYAVIKSPEAQSVTIGASADWWMEWYVNGKKVYDTLQSGNGSGYALTDHTFSIPLNKGENLLAVRVLSGSGGWKLLCGGPAELEAMKSGGMNRSVKFTLTEQGKELVSQSTVVEISRPVTAITGINGKNTSSILCKEMPFAVMSEESLKNLHEKQPDRSMWWQGDNDLSARLWLGCDEKNLYVVARVIDDALKTPVEKSAMWKSDSLQIGVTENRDAPIQEFCIGKVDGEVCVWKYGTSGIKEGLVADEGIVSAEISTDTDGTQVYTVVISRSMFRTNQILFNALVNDDDAGYRKQWIELRPGLGEEKKTDEWVSIWMK